MVIKTAARSLLHILFPHVCACCGSDHISQRQLLCSHCLHQLPLTYFHLYTGNPVEKIFYGRIPLQAACSWLFFTQDSLTQGLVHQLKYKGRKEVGIFAGKKIGEALGRSGRFDTVDALIPLPLDPSRERLRGYNQAAVLCEGIASVLGLPVLAGVVTRTHPTVTQTHKNRLERWQNMQDGFGIKQQPAVAGRHVLLVDDVITTGATLEACGRELLEAGVAKLSIATMACTMR